MKLSAPEGMTSHQLGIFLLANPDVPVMVAEWEFVEGRLDHEPVTEASFSGPGVVIS